MRQHHLPASVATCHWGFFESKLPPALTVKSGDRVVIDTVTGGPDVHPQVGAGFSTPPEIADIHARSERQVPGHILTGPVAIDGAQPGDVLEVRILDVALRQDWGYNVIRPLAGTLQGDFHAYRLLHIPLDLKANVARLPWGTDLPLAPFFGVMGTAPPANWGRVSSLVPRAFGGNIDNKELVAGSTLYLPVFVEGGRFSCGDGHGAQGDGEVCVTAIETALQGTFQFILRKDLAFTYPRAEIPTHYITMGMDPDLDRCVDMALRDMIVLMGDVAGLSAEDAYTFCSLAADLRITQTVNGSKGVHCMIRKSLLKAKVA
jgi:acetamidase/formamidase